MDCKKILNKDMNIEWGTVIKEAFGLIFNGKGSEKARIKKINSLKKKGDALLIFN